MMNFKTTVISFGELGNSISLKHVNTNQLLKLEKIVAANYGVSVEDLNTWYRSNEAKDCFLFLMHRLLGVSVYSIARSYKVYILRLKFVITNQSEKLKRNKAFRDRLNEITNAFFNSNNQS